MKNSLIIIPARGGSKGIKNKNIKLLHNKPLLYYTIDLARKLTSDSNICLSTDSSKIIKLANDYGLNVPFVRPKTLSNDKASMLSVIKHALEFYEKNGKSFKSIILLQPTSPFRTIKDVKNAYKLYNDKIDMVVSVAKTKNNPFYNLFYLNNKNYLQSYSKENYIATRQEAKNFYSFNGAVYIMNVNSIMKENISINNFKKVKKSEMDLIRSIDIDTIDDWHFAEYILDQRKIQLI
jgi:N-acylneuraminate cytidylyltransferase